MAPTNHDRSLGESCQGRRQRRATQCSADQLLRTPKSEEMHMKHAACFHHDLQSNQFTLKDLHRQRIGSPLPSRELQFVNTDS